VNEEFYLSKVSNFVHGISKFGLYFITDCSSSKLLKMLQKRDWRRPESENCQNASGGDTMRRR
jgi:hypothetical protein